jgi:hypothetical protein
MLLVVPETFQQRAERVCMLLSGDKAGGQTPVSVQQEHQPPAGDTALNLHRKYVYQMQT